MKLGIGKWFKTIEKADRLPEAKKSQAARDAERVSDALNKEVAQAITRATSDLTRFMTVHGEAAQKLLAAARRRIRIGGYLYKGRGKSIYLEENGLCARTHDACHEATIEEAAACFVAFGPRYPAGVAAWLVYQLNLIAVDIQLAGK